jgi:hypothetical protein
MGNRGPRCRSEHLGTLGTSRKITPSGQSPAARGNRTTARSLRIPGNNLLDTQQRHETVHRRSATSNGQGWVDRRSSGGGVMAVVPFVQTPAIDPQPTETGLQHGRDILHPRPTLDHRIRPPNSSRTRSDQSSWRQSKSQDSDHEHSEHECLTNRNDLKATVCVNFVWINDEEFDFKRRPISVSCDRYGPTFTVWSQQNDFTSQWTLLY